MELPQIISLLSGIALFLFGMTLMGDGLKRVSGNKLEPILFRLSNTQLKGVLLGTGVTAVIQSSCATSVMAVGFVNSGLMKVRQAISVILGAILGTSITGWVICLSYLDSASGIGSLLSTATLTGIISVVGIFFRIFSKDQTRQHIGDILMGFAVLMFGMGNMSNAVSELGKQDWFMDTLTSLFHPLPGILVGAAFTALLQSASAAVGILQALSVTGLLTLNASLPLLMGVTIGASVPVLLSALGANTNGKRTAVIYPTASTIGVIVCASLFYLANFFFRFSFMEMIMTPFSMALVNTMLRLAMLCLLLPFTDALEALVTQIIPENKFSEREDIIIHLEDRFINHPALAIEQSKRTITAMAELARDSLKAAFGLLSDYSENGYQRVKALETSVDRYEDALGSYLVKLTGQELTERQSREVSKFLHALSDFERISDHALNIADSAREIHEKQVTFSEDAWRELSVVTAAVNEAVCLTTASFIAGDLAMANKVEPLEEVIDNLCDELKLHHVNRLQQGKCTIHQGFIFNDLLTSFERASDHCSNIAVAMIELDLGCYDTHEYLGRIKEKRTPDFDRYFEGYRTRFEL